MHPETLAQTLGNENIFSVYGKTLNFSPKYLTTIFILLPFPFKGAEEPLQVPAHSDPNGSQAKRGLPQRGNWGSARPPDCLEPLMGVIKFLYTNDQLSGKNNKNYRRIPTPI